MVPYSGVSCPHYDTKQSTYLLKYRYAKRDPYNQSGVAIYCRLGCNWGKLGKYQEFDINAVLNVCASEVIGFQSLRYITRFSRVANLADTYVLWDARTVHA